MRGSLFRADAASKDTIDVARGREDSRVAILDTLVINGAETQEYPE